MNAFHRMNKNTPRLFLLSFLLSQLLLSHIALAQTTTASNSLPQYSGAEATIQQFLCTPTTDNSGTTLSLSKTSSTYAGPSTAGQTNTANNDLYNCINRMYRFSIVVAAIIGVFFIVIAGYYYMSADGNKESVDKAKSIITSTLTSLVILFGGYVLLRALNPDLVQFQNVQPPSVTVSSSTYQGGTTITPPGGTGTTPPGGGTTAPPGGITPPGVTTPPVRTTPTPNGNKDTSPICAPDPNYNCNEPGVAAKCSQYDSAFQKYGSVIPVSNGASLLKAMAYHETRCQPDKTDGKSYGIIQMNVSTANNTTPNFKAQCGITDTITSAWFATHPTESICLSAYYLKYLSQSNICGTDVGRLLSGYASGQATCQSRSTCPLAASQFLTCYNQF